MTPFKSLQNELATQLKMITKCVQTTLKHIQEVEGKLQEDTANDAEHPHMGSDTARLKILNTQQNLFDVLFVNFQHSLNESFNTYLTASFPETLTSAQASTSDSNEDYSTLKNTKIQQKMISFHRHKLTSLCKYFGYRVPRVLCFQTPSGQHSEDTAKLNALIEAALQFDAVISWGFYPYFTSVIVRYESTTESEPSADSLDTYPCDELYLGTPIVSTDWLSRSIRKGKWIPIQHTASSKSSSTSSSRSTAPRFSGLTKSIDFVLHEKGRDSSEKTDRKNTSEEDFGTDDEIERQDASEYLENALRLFEETIDTSDALAEVEDTRAARSVPSKPIKRITRADLLKFSGNEKQAKCPHATRKSPKPIHRSELAKYDMLQFPDRITQNTEAFSRGTLPVESQVVQYVHPRQTSAKSTPKQVFCFQFTSASPRGELLDVITTFGSTFDISPKCSPAATHLVVSGEPNVKSEKLLGFSIQSKWLVSDEFLLASKDLGYWADETQFEIHQDGSYAQHIRRTLRKPFAGWKALMCSSRESHKSMATMLVLGGALDAVSISKRRGKTDFTHVFYDMSTLDMPLDGSALNHFYTKNHRIALRGAGDICAKVKGGEITPVCLEYILDLFSQFCDEGELKEGVRRKVKEQRIEHALAEKTLKKMAKLVQMAEIS